MENYKSDTSDSIVISIHPKYVRMIERGEKTHEFRKWTFKTAPILKHSKQRLFLYETAPISAITSELKWGEISVRNIEDLWINFGNKSGLSKEQFFKYYENKEHGMAIKIIEIHRISLIKISNPPQNWMYFRNINQI